MPLIGLLCSVAGLKELNVPALCNIDKKYAFNF